MDRSAIDALQMHGQDVPWMVRHWATHRPDHTALVWEPAEGEGRSWTYAQLREATEGLAAGLRDRGIEPGDKVLIHAENCPEMLLAWLACGTVGAVAVTTNTRSAPSEVGWFIDKARCVAAITQPRFTEHVATASEALRWVAVIGDDAPADGALRFSDLEGDASTWEPRPIEPLRPFGIMFTSGTTNKPKAVVHTHANAVWAGRVGPRNIDLGPDDRYLIYLPLFHVNAQSWSMFSVLGVGATAVLMPKWSTSRFWDVVARHGITHISLMPFVIPTLMQEDKPETALRVGVFGLIMEVLDQMCGIDVYAAYGMTETVIHATNGKPSQRLPERSMGRPTPGYEALVVDQETGEPCPEGVPGELWLRGTRGIQLFLEYFDNPEANEKAFEDGWFKTGDIVVLGEGGNLFYRERDKDLLKVGGENVSAREVEDVAGTVAGVAQVAVVGKTHEFLDEVVVAFVVAAPDAPDEATLEAQVIEACKGQLADFKVPRAVYAVDAFPTGTLDKILKNELRAMADARPEV
ncbi:AMP-binding protein [Iamia majanohamensis]|uniref:AMP-binding protein n=1 Tax=Iamia majanohamensis TaxID=467976 RepID=A0AAE9Y7R5_9ACTN|nr:AMP-binding protein [Iamia majanohamensis]WCO68097.1 AMP-binding protein [Iamia majanohamensis]